MVQKIIKNSSGFTLIEVMIALVVMTYGILAIMAMSVSAIQGNSHADNITNSTILADEVFEMIRANVDNINIYNGIDTDDEEQATRPSDVANPAAAGDYDTMEARLAAIDLPSGACAIQITPSGGIDTAQVAISWTRSGDHLMTFSRGFAAAK